MNVITLENERWDSLCYRVYGAVTQIAINELRAANKEAVTKQHDFVLPAGLVITVPTIVLQTIKPVELAPWQR